MPMLVLKTPAEVRAWRQSLPSKASVGFVPTMGALHAGHESLLQKSRSENDFSVLSIFVNPTQFNDPKDFENYPITWDSDLEIARRQNVDVVWAPTPAVMYPDGYHYKVIEDNLSLKLCGKNRPGHFDGVLTVVMKLLNTTQPTKAYFGEKDFQQMSLVSGMVKSFFLPYEIVAVPTMREADGLAMSSRNLRLKPEQRKIAPLIHQTLETAESDVKAREVLEKAGLKVDYIEDIDNRRYAAVVVGEVRLIDNIQI